MKHKQKHQKKLLFVPTKRRLVFLTIVNLSIVLLVGYAAWSARTPKDARANWYNDTFAHRQRIPISNTSGVEKTNFQIQLSLNTATLITNGQMQTTCADMRFTNQGGQELSYWLEPNTCNTSATVVFVKLPTVPTTGSNIYWYYGNPTALSQSQTSDVFIKEIDSAVVHWPLDDTDTNQSYARVVQTGKNEGRDIVINGGFDTDTVWSKGDGWTISGGVANYTAGTQGLLNQSSVVVPGKAYEATYTISNYVSGSVGLYIGSRSGTPRSSNGTYTETIIANTTTGFYFYPASADFIGSIDNLSIQEVSIPSSSTTSTNLLTDGDMETSGTNAWTANNGAILTKQTNNPFSGNQVIRVAYNGQSSPAAFQNVTTIGTLYRVYGYARSDGTELPRVRNGNGTIIWTGTNSTSWQPFDLIFVQTGGSAVQFGTNSNSGYVEFDQIVVSTDTAIRSGEILLDGDMEAAGTGFWPNTTGTGSKQTNNPYAGLQVLRVTHTGTNDPYLTVQAFVSGKTYRVSGYARSDGFAIPRLGNNASIWQGTTATSWQQFDFIFTASQSTLLPRAITSTAGQYVEFDNISVTEVAPTVGTFTSSATKPTLNTTANGHLEKAYSFDGANDHINIYSSTLNSVFNPNEGTLVAWAKVANAGVWTDGTLRSLFELYAGGENRIELAKNTSNNSFYLGYVAGNVGKFSNITLSSTSWTSYVITWSKSKDEFKIFINGVQNGSTQTGLGNWSGNVSSTAFTLGAANTTGTFPWSGLINDVRLYDRALTADEISSMYSATTDIQLYSTNNYLGKELVRQFDPNVTAGTPASAEKAPGPIAFWRFEEGQGQTVQDSSGNQHTGTLGASTSSSSDDPTWVTEDLCISGKCLQFDGTNDVVSVANTSSLNPNTSFTFSVWARPVASTGTMQMLYQSGTNTNMWNFNIAQNNILRYTETGLSDYNSNYTVTFDNKWHHFVVVKNGDGTNNVTFYVDGVFQGTVNAGPVQATSGTKYLGNNNAGDRPFRGFLDEPKIYPYARTAEEIKQDYLLGAANAGAQAVIGTTTPSTLSNGLVGYWKMDETSGTVVADASGNGNNGTLTNAQETGTADASGGSTTTLVDTDGTLSTSDDAYNGMILRVTNTCGSITANTDRVISDYTGATKTFTVSAAFASTLDSCQYQILHQVGGKYGNGVGFDGGDDYTNIYSSNLASQFNGSEGTLSGWAKVTDINTWSDGTAKSYVTFRVDSNNTIGMQIVNNSFNLAYIANGIQHNAYFSQTVNTNWFHTVISWSKRQNKITFYLNGQIVGSGTGLGDWSGSLTNTSTVIGATTASSQFWQGLVDEVRIYNRALSPAEVADLYNFAPGPVGYWKFDEISGSNVLDSSGNGNSWNLIGADRVPGKINNSLSFNGGDYVSGTSLGPLTQFSAQAWIKLDPSIVASGGYWNVFGDDPGFGATALSYTSIETTQRRLAWFTGSAWVSGTTALDDGKWHHVVYQFINGAYYMWLDGKLEYNNTFGNGTYTDGTLEFIGAISASNRARDFSGLIDEVKIYNYARTQEQILQDMAGSEPPSSLGGKLPDPVAHYAFDEQTGQTINNSSPLGTASSLNGTRGANSSSASDDPTWKTKADCKINGCLDFDGTNDYAVVSNNSALYPGTGNFGMSFWINTSSSGSRIAILNKTNTVGSEEGYAVMMESDGKLKVRTGDLVATRGEFTTTTNTINDGTWKHIAISYFRNESQPFVYINGVKVAMTTNVGSFANQTSNIDNTEALQIGYCSINTAYCGTYFDGTIDEVKIWNTALTPDQVLQEYNAGASVNFGSTAAAEASLLSDGAGSPPVGHWNFDDNQGTTLKDISGNQNNGTLNLGPDWVSGKIGSAVYFDGVDDYIQITDPANGSLDFGTGDMTIQGWFKTTWSPPTGVPIIDKKSGGSNNAGYNLNLQTDGKPYFRIANGTTQQSIVATQAVINDGTWHHVAGVLSRSDTSKLKIYVDGKLAGSTASDVSSWNIDSANSLDFGRLNNNSSFYPGSMDDIKIYNYARTPAQIAYDYNRGKPIAHWRMDECEGSTIYDSSGNNTSGTLTVGGAGTQTAIGTCATASTAWGNGASGKLNSSLNFDGTDDYVDLGDLTFLEGATQATWSFWTKPSNLSALLCFICKFNNNNSQTGWALETSLQNYGGTDELIIGIPNSANDPNTIAYTSSNVFTINNWTHIVVRYDGTKSTNAERLKVFANGQETTLTFNGTIPSSLVATTSPARIGSTSDSARFFPGQIDDVQIYNYPLSADQVKILYNNGAATFR